MTLDERRRRLDLVHQLLLVLLCLVVGAVLLLFVVDRLAFVSRTLAELFGALVVG